MSWREGEQEFDLHQRGHPLQTRSRIRIQSRSRTTLRTSLRILLYRGARKDGQGKKAACQWRVPLVSYHDVVLRETGGCKVAVLK